MGQLLWRQITKKLCKQEVRLGDNDDKLSKNVKDKMLLRTRFSVYIPRIINIQGLSKNITFLIFHRIFSRNRILSLKFHKTK